MSNNIRRFLTGKRYNNMNWKGLLVLLLLAFPSFMMDLVVIRLYLSGQAWVNFTSSINIGPYIGIWAVPCAMLSGTMSAILIISIWSIRNPRISRDDDPMKNRKE